MLDKNCKINKMEGRVIRHLRGVSWIVSKLIKIKLEETLDENDMLGDNHKRKIFVIVS